MSCLHYAAQQYTGYLSMLAIREYDQKNDYKFDVNCRTGLKATPLHFAVICREFNNVELLIKLNADLNAQDSKGNTPLMLAIIRMCTEMACAREEHEEDFEGSQIDLDTMEVVNEIYV